MADRHATRVVALFSASDETVALLQWMRGISGVNEFIWCRFEDVKRGRVDFTEYLTEHNPEVVIIDISPPYQENWQFFQTLRAAQAMKGRGLVLITTNKARLDAVLQEDSHAINIVGNTGVLLHIVTAIEAAANNLKPDTPPLDSTVQAALRRNPRRGPPATKTWERRW
jgi:hypothetical protein